MLARGTFEWRYFEDPDYPPGLKGGDEVRGYGYFPDYFATVQAQLAALIEVANVATLLDAGCGKGALAEYARRDLAVAVTGLDCSAYATDCARRRAGGECTVRGDIATLPFPAAAFDAVWCNGILQYLDAEAARAALGELARVARRAIFVSNIAAVHEHGEWGRRDPLTRLYLRPTQWQALAQACALEAIALPFEGESALLVAGGQLGGVLRALALRFVERSLENLLHLGALRRSPPALAAFRCRAGDRR